MRYECQPLSEYFHVVFVDSVLIERANFILGLSTCTPTLLGFTFFTIRRVGALPSMPSPSNSTMSYLGGFVDDFPGLTVFSCKNTDVDVQGRGKIFRAGRSGQFYFWCSRCTQLVLSDVNVQKTK